MKKLVLFLAVATAVAFASCGNKEAKTEEAPVTEEPAVEVVAPVEEVAGEAAEVVESEPLPEIEAAAPSEVVAEEVKPESELVEAVKADVAAMKEVVNAVDNTVKVVEKAEKK